MFRHPAWVFGDLRSQIYQIGLVLGALRPSVLLLADYEDR